jgi:protein phosphatase-4 regulatory subunit 3
MQRITYVRTFTELINRYEQFHDPTLPSRYQQQDPNHSPRYVAAASLGSTALLNPDRRQINGGANPRWQGVREIDADEEAYFNGSDDEDNKDEEGENVPPPTVETKITPVKILDGSPTIIRKPLVDYGDDEDEETKEDSTTTTTTDVPTPAASPPEKRQQQEDVVVPPPKRRREKEDDDEDELGKLAQQRSAKRRSPSTTPTAAAAAAGGTKTPTMGRKRSFNLLGGTIAARESPNKKIAISLAPKGTTTAAETKSGTPSPTTPTEMAAATTTTTTTVIATETKEEEQGEKKEG